MAETKQATLTGRKLFIGIPAYDGKLNIKTAFALAQLMPKAMSLGVSVTLSDLSNCSIITMARNALVHEFLKTECTELLFIDADVRFFKDTVIQDAVNTMESKNLDLIGLKIKCYDKDPRAKLGFVIFNTINHALKFFSPFAVGAFMLTRRDRFEDFGGFPEQFSTSEDYFLSRKYSPKKFRIIRHHFGQDSRRFKKMGYLGMATYLVKNFVNRNNKAYWDKLDSSRYWS